MLPRNAEPPCEPLSRARRSWRIALGVMLAATLLLACTEAFLRFFPPPDLYPYLGEASPLTGPYRADPDFALTYRDWKTFRDDNAERLTPFLPLDRPSDTRPIWAMFGNSFVHAQGMLADQARARLTDRAIFNLGRNEFLPLRCAQVRLLLENGFKPERLFFALMPTDVVGLGKQPLETIHVTSRGALTYDLHAPNGPIGWLVQKTRIGRTAWVRSGKNTGNLRFNARKVYEQVDPILLSDLRQLFTRMARTARERGVPITVMLIPAYHQIAEGASMKFQDTLKPMLLEAGCDVFDPRDAFCSHTQPKSLFIPDKHFNDEGNAILLRELRQHVEALERASHVSGRSSPDSPHLRGGLALEAP